MNMMSNWRNHSLVSKQKVTPKITITALGLCILLFGVFLVNSNQVKARDYDAEIRAIQKEIDAYESKASKLSEKTNTLQSALRKLANEKAKIQTQINLYKAENKKLTKEIADTKARIKENKLISGELIINDAVGSDVSPIIRLAGSENLANYIDSSVNDASAQQDILDKIDEIEKLKAQLEKKQKEVEENLEKQTAKRDEKAQREADQRALIAKTKNSEAGYRALINESNKQVSEIRRQQQAQAAQFMDQSGNIAVSSSNGSITYDNFNGEYGCGGGYRYCWAYHDQWVNDPWGLHLARECVHYTADFLARNGYRIPSGAFAGRGNASQWVGTTTSLGFAYLVGNPQHGDIVYMPIGPVGHVGVVESNYGNGWIKISQFNFGVTGLYSTMDLKITPNLQFMRFRR